MSSEARSEELKEKGNKLFREGHYGDAVSKYSEALILNPTGVVLYSNRSIAYSKLYDYQNALADACKCIELSPQWQKGYLRKLTALEGLARHEEAMAVAANGFKVTGEGRMKREFVERWLKASQELNRLPEGSIELPRGILILSKNYLTVLACLLRSLSGEQPLSQALVEQCLYSCSQQLEKVLSDFGEVVGEVITQWFKHLAAEVYPYVVEPSNKEDLEKKMASRTDGFVHFLEEIDPALYPILRPILGLVVLVILNRTNILCESNAAHHAAELMNRALVPLLESPTLKTDDYYSMYIGRICAVLDSFIGRGYKLSVKESSTVTSYYHKLKKAIESYPKHLPEYGKDRQLAEMALSNVKSNVLEPPTSHQTPSLSSAHAPAMSIEVAQGIVKDKPAEVQHFLTKHLTVLEHVKFLTMRDVEELLTMTGIFLDLGDKDSAIKVFTKGEAAFFQVLGHLLSTNALKLDQCPATIAQFRQFVLSQAALLMQPELFATIILRWKCLFTELRTQLVRMGLGAAFGEFFQWYIRQRASTTQTSKAVQETALLQQLQKEEELLQLHAVAILDALGSQSHQSLLETLNNGEAILDYVIFPTLKEAPLAEAFCMVSEKGRAPVVTQLNYTALRRVAAVAAHVISLSQKLRRQDKESSQVEARIRLELASLVQVLFPQPVMDILNSDRIKHLYISPDGDIAHLPLNLLPFPTNQSGLEHKYLLDRFSVSLLSSSQELIRPQLTKALQSKQALSPIVPECSDSPPTRQCLIVADPNYSLQQRAPETSLLLSLIYQLSEYLDISEGCPSVEQLMHSREEAEFISSCLKAAGLDVRKLIGDDATLSNILSCSSPLLLHISSHAYGTARQTAYRGNFFAALNSAIALAGLNTYQQQKFSELPPECGTGQLPALAVLSMQLLGTRLVFLSTCNSAAGSSSVQEATDNLAQSFLAAGAETVIATLWPVGDSPAAEFCKFFYEYFKDPGVRPSQALTYAKQQISSDPAYAHWSHWGSFMCFGIDKAIL